MIRKVNISWSSWQILTFLWRIISVISYHLSSALTSPHLSQPLTQTTRQSRHPSTTFHWREKWSNFLFVICVTMSGSRSWCKYILFKIYKGTLTATSLQECTIFQHKRLSQAKNWIIQYQFSPHHYSLW